MSATTAKTIRAALKSELGLNSRQVSVRARSFAGGSSVDVEVKSTSVDFAAVTEIAERSERIDRCQVTGEILSGGNTYIHVSYTEEVRRELSALYVEEARIAIAEVDATDKTSTILVPIGTTEVLIGRGANSWGYQLWNNGTAGMNVDHAESAALYTAFYVKERGTVEQVEETAMEAWITREAA